MSRSHGIKGEIFIRPFNSQAHWPQGISSIKIGERFFLMEYYSSHKQGFIVKLKGCDTKEDADQLKSKPVFLAKEDFISAKGEDIYLMELLGFDIFSTGYGKLGKVIQFQTGKKRDFLVVSSDSNKKTAEAQLLSESQNYLVPFVSTYIQKIDFEKKELILNLPKNFLSLFRT